MISVLIADDHAIVRQGLIQAVARSGDIVVAGEASTGQEALQKSLSHQYDVILLDISLPDIGGIDVLKELKHQRPELAVLMLSIYPEEQYALRAMKAGASGYVTKEATIADLLAAVRKVARGGKYVSPSLAERLASVIETGTKEPLHQSLTDREYQVMTMIASGKRIREIAEELYLGISTVHTYRARILRKMQMRSDSDLIRYATQERLID